MYLLDVLAFTLIVYIYLLNIVCGLCLQKSIEKDFGGDIGICDLNIPSIWPVLEVFVSAHTWSVLVETVPQKCYWLRYIFLKDNNASLMKRLYILMVLQSYGQLCLKQYIFLDYCLRPMNKNECLFPVEWVNQIFTCIPALQQISIQKTKHTQENWHILKTVPIANAQDHLYSTIA